MLADTEPRMAVYPSGNEKIGRMCAVYLPIANTCTEHGLCPLQNAGCYAQTGYVGIHQRRIERALVKKSCCAVVRIATEQIKAVAQSGKVPFGTPCRWAVSGDVGCVDCAKLVADAAKVWEECTGGALYGYTHAWSIIPRRAFGRARIMASTESLQLARKARRRGYRPAVVVARHESAKAESHGTAGRITPCPQQTRGVTCSDCKLCFSNADTGVSFAVHGQSSKRALRVIQ